MPNFIWYIILIALTFLIHRFSYKYAHSLKLISAPNIRSSHSGEVPNSGGLVIFLPILIVQLCSPWDTNLIGLICTYSLVIFGLLDDRFDINHKVKFIFQILLSIIFIHLNESYINNLHGLFGVEQISYNSSLIISIITIVGIINAINLIDGIDGLAGLLSLYSFITLRTLIGEWDEFSLALIISLLIFTCFNFQQNKKIFLGDTGSMAIGFLIAVNTIELYTNPIHSQSLIANDEHKLILCVVILAYPIFDTLRVFTIRMLNGDSPFQADKRHLHHRLLQSGFSHSEASHFIVVLSILFTLFNITILDSIRTEYLIALDLLLIFGSLKIIMLNLFAIQSRWRNYHHKVTKPIVVLYDIVVSKQ